MSDDHHPHDPSHGHDHTHRHGHSHGVVDPSIATTDRGLWAIKWSFVGLTATAALQLVVVIMSGSVALLADTIHNFGDAATADNDYGFEKLPKISGNHSHFATMLRALDGGLDGFFVMGQNPAAGSQHSGLQRRALAEMKWVVVRDLAEIETANFWRDSPEVQSGELKTEDIQTEVFLMPAA